MPNDDKTPIDRLAENGRIKGASRVIPDGAVPDAVTAEMGRDVVQAVLDYITAAGMSRAAVARSLGISSAALGATLNWNYPGCWQQIVIDLDRWLEEQIRRDATPRPSTFIFTKVAREIETVANVATTLKTIGLVYGPDTSGIGKTLALRAIAAEKPGSGMVTIEKLTATAGSLVFAIAKALRIGASNDRGSTYERIKQSLVGTPRLLIIDQIHNLCGAAGDKPLFVLSDLFDATGSPQLWCGTLDIKNYLQRGQARGQGSLAQISRRIGIARDLMERTRSGDDGGPGEPLYDIDEIREVFARNKMRLTPEAARYLLSLANVPDSGALGACCNLVAMATAINEHAASELTVEMLRAAHRFLVSGPAFAAVEGRMSEPPPARAIARAG
jgi:hypothetical protein